MRPCPPVQHTFFPCCLHYHLLNLSQCFPNIAWLSCLGIPDITECILQLGTFSKRTYHPLQPQFASMCPTRQLFGKYPSAKLDSAFTLRQLNEGTHADPQRQISLCPSRCVFCRVVHIVGISFYLPCFSWGGRKEDV